MASPRMNKRRSQLRAAYNISEEDYEAMASVQEGMCAICDGEDERKRADGTPYPLSVDHDHSDGRVRGLLCNRCNAGLGMFREDIDALQRAIEYLKLYTKRRPV